MKNDHQKQTPLSDYKASSSLGEISKEDSSLCGQAAQGEAFWEAVLRVWCQAAPPP